MGYHDREGFWREENPWDLVAETVSRHTPKGFLRRELGEEQKLTSELVRERTQLQADLQAKLLELDGVQWDLECEQQMTSHLRQDLQRLRQEFQPFRSRRDLLWAVLLLISIALGVLL